MEQNVQHSRRERYLTFFLGEEQYGIAIDRIKEIIAIMKVTNVPKTPEYMRGVINLRGSIIPVVDTRLRFGMETKDEDMHTAIVIVEVDKVNVGGGHLAKGHPMGATGAILVSSLLDALDACEGRYGIVVAAGAAGVGAALISVRLG